MPATVQKCFDQFLQNARIRSEETMQKWEKERTSLGSNLDNFYEQECLKVHPELPEHVLEILRKLHSTAKNSIEAMFHAFSASQHEDAKYFGIRLKKTQMDVMSIHEHELQQNKEEINMARAALKDFKTHVHKQVNNRSDRATRDNRQRRSDTPGSGGLHFESAQIRSRKKSPRTPVFLQSRPTKATAKGTAMRQNQKLEPIVEPATRNVPTRSPGRSPVRSVLSGHSAHTSPEASPPVRDPSTSRRSQSPKSDHSQFEEFKDGKFEELHDAMRDSIEFASELNQEYEDNLVMVDTDRPSLENMYDDEDEWQDDEEYVPRRTFDELSAKNSRLVEENRDLDEANADLREKNDKFQGMINGLTYMNGELEREIGELRLCSPDRGLPADDTNQTGMQTWDGAGQGLDVQGLDGQGLDGQGLSIPSSPDETEQREVPAMLNTPSTVGKVKSPSSVLPSPSPYDNISTGTSKLTSPVSPSSSDTTSSDGSIQGTPTKASAPTPGSLHRFNSSDMGSTVDPSQYPDSMSTVVARLRAAITRCNIEIQTCQKDMKTSQGHQTSSKSMFERWQNAARKHRHDFLETVMYFESVKTKPAPSKDDFRAGSSSFGGSTRSFGSSPPPSSMGNSFESEFVGGSQWDEPERASPQSGNAPELAGPKGKPDEPERVQASSPMEGSSDKKGSTQESSSSFSGDGSKKNQSEPKPQTQPQDSQDSQESSSPRTGTRGTKPSAPRGQKKPKTLLGRLFWGLPFIQERVMDPLLAAMFPVLVPYYSRFDRWMGRQVRNRLPSYAIATMLTIGLLCLYIKTYSVYLVLLRERNMWLEANRIAPILMLKRAAMSSEISVWGLREEQGLIRSVDHFMEFMCWSLGITALKNWILNECVVWPYLADLGGPAEQGNFLEDR
ncbi:hypothetical protein FPOAC1_004634 [Fusarium poae]|uniref:hypothetical protein n=1 Tax=Fusarium poae TaxID=36050 RepID=UPI001CE91849|nr:hypothetical protein FPOAC1_004634 [Fusarium poae]KAG8671387.1 hypothetical protein FPOAC1_004634 [Fusarium poae]